jgi:hypothetical protein
LVGTLGSRGVTITDAGAISQAFFSVPGRIIQVQGEDVQVSNLRHPA